MMKEVINHNCGFDRSHITAYTYKWIYVYVMRNAMSDTENTRLTIIWSKETDLALRSFLGAQGLKKGALSKFIEDAVKWRLFDQTVSEVRAAFADVPPDRLENMIDEAVRDVRKDMRQERQSRTER